MSVLGYGSHESDTTYGASSRAITNVENERREPLRPGDRVALRAPEEILATLDAHGALSGLPFMPEMLEYFGRTLTVWKRAHKICDTICPLGSRKMENCVYLDELRCGGASHGGCQAECRIYWKDEWLIKVNPGDELPAIRPESLGRLRAFVESQVRQPSRPDCFRCQATEARRASAKLPEWDLRQYRDEVTSGNATLTDLLQVARTAVPLELRRFAHFVLPAGARLLMRRWFRPHNLQTPKHAPPQPLNLQPGEWVEVRSPEEIQATLNARGANLGLVFAGAEMLPACGKRYRVRRRINRIIDEATGRMLEMKHDCIALEGMVCGGDRSVGRWLCHREIYAYWREAWLKRADPP